MKKKCIPVILLSLGTSTNIAGPAHRNNQAFKWKLWNGSIIITCVPVGKLEGSKHRAGSRDIT